MNAKNTLISRLPLFLSDQVFDIGFDRCCHQAPTLLNMAIHDERFDFRFGLFHA